MGSNLFLAIPGATAPPSLDPPRARSRRLKGPTPEARERARLAALHASGLLDTPPEEPFDRLAKLAATALRAPAALISLVDADRQFFKATYGLPAPYGALRETPLSHSFCRLVAREGRPLAVGDTASDPRVAGNPGIQAFGIGAYLGVPLATEAGHVLGSLCVVDTSARSWDEREIGLLSDLAEAVMAVVRLREEVARRETVERDLRERREQLDRALEVSGRVGVWGWDLASRRLTLDGNLARILGLPPGVAGTGLDRATLSAAIHPEDLPAVREATRAAIRDGQPHECEYRVRRPDGSVAWLQSRGGVYPGPGGVPRIAGVVADITAQRLALEQQEEISGELAHRVKNMLATTQAVVTQTLRESTSLAEAGEAVVARLHALSRAHDLLVAKGWTGAGLHEIASGIASTFGASRFDVSGPAEVTLNPRLALAMSMALHELATNAAKYGSLSNATGRVRITWDPGPAGGFLLSWTEGGGPPVAEPARRGFGSKLLDRVLAAETGGGVERMFRSSGVVVTIQVA